MRSFADNIRGSVSSWSPQPKEASEPAVVLAIRRRYTSRRCRCHGSGLQLILHAGVAATAAPASAAGSAAGSYGGSGGGSYVGSGGGSYGGSYGGSAVGSGGGSGGGSEGSELFLLKAPRV